MLEKVICPSCGAYVYVNSPNQPGPPTQKTDGTGLVVGAIMGGLIGGPFGAIIGAGLGGGSVSVPSVEEARTACFRCKRTIIVRRSGRKQTVSSG